MTEFKVGDKVKILKNRYYHDAPNGVYKKGEIHIVSFIDNSGDPCFIGDTNQVGWGKHHDWFRKVEEPNNNELIQYLKENYHNNIEVSYILKRFFGISLSYKSIPVWSDEQ